MRFRVKPSTSHDYLEILVLEFWVAACTSICTVWERATEVQSSEDTLFLYFLLQEWYLCGLLQCKYGIV